MSERMWPEAEQPRLQPEKIAETMAILQEEYQVLTVDRALQMTEVEYRKMLDIKSRIPDLTGHEEGTLSEEVVLAQFFLIEVVDVSLGEMEQYLEEHGGQWKDMTI